ncbi:unnamed protein product [Orchesella dallaii]|uniref:60S ribosomal protein L31 n=1 Tax=Orchesella dallaii TaxID=48710 RepID=A0ABP1QK81_9HEXA
MAKQKGEKKKSTMNEVLSRVYTINLHRRLHGIRFKYRAPRAIDEVRKFAQQQMGTQDVRIEETVNKQVWSRGVRNVPFKLRVKLERRRNDDEDSVHKLYTIVSFVPVASFKGLQTLNAESSK